LYLEARLHLWGAEVLMLKVSVAAVAVCAALATACGGSPTAPQSIDVRTTQSGTDAGSAPVPPSANPTTPAPAPAPPPSPAPAPAPAPAPEPAPPTDVETWHAHVDVQRASSPAVALPADFTVTVRGDQMQFGSLNVTILVRQGTHIYARKGQEITIEIDDGKWTVTSVDVFATGTISYTAP
jgi:hypothetical protein